MSYNTDRRKPLTKAQRPAFLAANDGRCYFCGEPITDDAWDDEHVIAKELMAPGSDWNAMENRKPIHRKPCHKIKTAQDAALIAKSNRIRRANGPVDQRKKTKKPIRSRPDFKWPSRPFPTRRNP